jgi:hypothetical protein
MTNIKAEDIKTGMGIKTWFGTHTVVAIKPYTEPFDFTYSILTFSNGSRMTTEKGHYYELAYEMGVN